MGKAFYQGKPLRPSLYICGVDVMAGELKAKIEAIDARHEFWGKTIAIAKCSTQEGSKMLRIGAEIEDSLVELFGADVTKWVGKAIVLYFAPEVRFKGKKVGGARIRTNNQTSQPAPARQEPDPKKSGDLTRAMLEQVGAAGSLDELTKISERIKRSARGLTKMDIEIVRREYKTRQDHLEAPPAKPETVDGPIDPITGEVEQVPAGVTGELELVKDTYGPQPDGEAKTGATHAADIPDCDFGGPE